MLTQRKILMCVCVNTPFITSYSFCVICWFSSARSLSFSLNRKKRFILRCSGQFKMANMYSIRFDFKLVIFPNGYNFFMCKINRNRWAAMSFCKIIGTDGSKWNGSCCFVFRMRKKKWQVVKVFNATTAFKTWLNLCKNQICTQLPVLG